ncbi:hypothetical protein LuPra_02178 [Luteitalea pratensis]|uniref:Uncharacterized protein n=1 Tax=Luteitalea pratensis TaxID=1855912 RepID=A0A143PL77_LUTPR|nr:hypothetical protein [Luteitalea pratensis]AMY08970.1 hypothetical protein LuPra_02178 [Luteitalea pratensis]
MRFRLAFIRTVTCTLLVVAPPGVVTAQPQEAHAHGQPGERLGSVHFPTSCASGVQPELDRGVAQLHSFWFSAAVASFQKVLASDSSCVMAHWGIALSWWGNPFAPSRSAASLEAGRAAAEAGRVSGAGTEREKAWLAAVALLYRDSATVDQRTRTLAYEKAMAAVVQQYPDDVEARIFHALALTQTALPTDKTYANQLQADAILEREFARQPEHPGLAHYIIHSLDVPALAPRALDAARRYAAIAPAAPHALHMPSHTFTRVGSWQESIDTNLASAAAARKDGATAEELHALDYQAYAYLQTAQDAAAGRTVVAIEALVSKISTTGPGNAAPPAAGHYALAAIPARYALEREDWAAAAALVPRETPTQWANAVSHFARALGAARTGNASAARQEIVRLEAIRDAVKASGDAYWSGQVEIQRRGAAAWATLADGKVAEALAEMREVAGLEDATEKAAVTPGPIKPARELLADMLMQVNRQAEALTEYEATLAKEPHRFRATYGAARAAVAAGDAQKAATHYANLVVLAEKADQPLRKEVVEARARAH